MEYSLMIRCCDKIHSSAMTKQIAVKFECMDQPATLLTVDKYTVKENKLKVSIWSHMQMSANPPRFYAGVCRFICKNVIRVNFVKTQFGMYKMELITKELEEERQVQNSYLYCIDRCHNNLVNLTPDKIRESRAKWQESLNWVLKEHSDASFTATVMHSD